MTAVFRELELLSQHINQAHRAALFSQLTARGLQGVGHPLMLLTILDQADDQRPQVHCHAQRELAELLHVSPAAVANSLKSLERSGYIHRRPGRDARRNQVTLTDKGRQAVQGCQESFETVSRRMLCDFSPEELNQLLSFRRRMLCNLRSDCSAADQAKEES